MKEETIWQMFDKIISHLVREGNINLAIDAGKARDEALRLLEENIKLSKRQASEKLTNALALSTDAQK